jgi:hypothetical protein
MDALPRQFMLRCSISNSRLFTTRDAPADRRHVAPRTWHGRSGPWPKAQRLAIPFQVIRYLRGLGDRRKLAFVSSRIEGQHVKRHGSARKRSGIRRFADVYPPSGLAISARFSRGWFPSEKNHLRTQNGLVFTPGYQPDVPGKARKIIFINRIRKPVFRPNPVRWFKGTHLLAYGAKP